MRKSIYYIVMAAFVVGISSCAQIPDEKVSSAFDKMSVVTEETAAKLNKAKTDKEAAEILIAHAHNIKEPMVVIRTMRLKFKNDLDENKAFKDGKLRAEASSKKLYDAMGIITKKYQNSDEILAAYGKMESIIKEGQSEIK